MAVRCGQSIGDEWRERMLFKIIERGRVEKGLLPFGDIPALREFIPEGKIICLQEKKTIYPRACSALRQIGYYDIQPDNEPQYLTPAAFCPFYDVCKLDWVIPE